MNVQKGDTVRRYLGGKVPIDLIVSEVTITKIICGPWTFDRATGAEIDEDLNWGPKHTGSYIERLPHEPN